MSIGENIKKARGHIKQAELAEMLNVDVSTISRWENNKNVPNGIILQKIAQVLGTSVEFLTEYYDETAPLINKTQTLQALKGKIADEDTTFDTPITASMTDRWIIIKDWNTKRTYYFPNNDEGRKSLADFTMCSLGIKTPPVSNAINGNNNTNNKLGIINH